MNQKRFSWKTLRSLCDQPGPGDGLDPRLEARGGPEPVKNRKALQLCAQVRRTLDGILAGEMDDDLLRDLLVESVIPAPNASRLLVTVSPSPAAAAVNADAVLVRLQQFAGRLRCAVAAAIHRRRTPELMFRIRQPADE